MNNILPFNEKEISNNVFIREFSQNINSQDLTWHIDPEDRIIEPLYETDWLFQFDNELPIRIFEQIRIPKGVYHRIIKGSDNLVIRVIKL